MTSYIGAMQTATATTVAASTGTSPALLSTPSLASLCLAWSPPLPRPARVVGLIPSGLGLPGYPTCTCALTWSSITDPPPQAATPGFSTTRPLVADAT
jgi:hypothetical protein